MTEFWVIKRCGTHSNGGAFVANPGHKFPYVRDVLRARRFSNQQEAQSCVSCDKEIPVRIVRMEVRG